jgi:hypothetical protein
MSLANKFFWMAVRESNCPDFNNVEERAAIAVSGCIGQSSDATTRDGFIRAGLNYVELFDEVADQAIQNEDARATYDGKGDRALTRYLKQLKKEARSVSIVELFDLLAQDWDERHAEAED